MATLNRYARLPLSQQPDESWLSQHQAWQATQQAAWVRDGGLLFSDEEEEGEDEEGEVTTSSTQPRVDPELMLSDEEDGSPPAAGAAAAVDPELLFSDEEDASMAGASKASLDPDLAFSDDEEASVAQASMAATLGDYSMNLLDDPPEAAEEAHAQAEDTAASAIQGESEVARAHRERLTEQRATVRRAIETAVTTFLRDVREVANGAQPADADVSDNGDTSSQASSRHGNASQDGDSLPDTLPPSPPSSQDSIMFAYSQDPTTHPAPAARPRRPRRLRVARFSLATADQDDDAATRRRSHLFPTSSSNSTRRLAQLLRVLEEMACALASGRVVTKRDVYYRAPALFGKQVVVDRLVEGVVSKLGVRRSATGIVAAPKGLVAGCGTLWLSASSGADEGPQQVASASTSTATQQQLQQQQVLSAAHATSIPDIDVLERIETTAQWVLVVEKEAVFRTLLEHRLAASSASSPGGIIMTGRGYPDLASREFLARLCEEKPSLRIYTLVDADPYGMDISELYRRSLPTSSSSRFQLLGISMVDVMSLELPTQPMSPADRKKATDMLAAGEKEGERRYLSERVKLQLNQMLLQGVKAEIEAVDIAARRRREAQLDEETQEEEALEDEEGLVEYLRAAMGLTS